LAVVVMRAATPTAPVDISKIVGLLSVYWSFAAGT